MTTRHKGPTVGISERTRQELREFKQRNSLSQVEFAAKLGISQSYLSRILTGERRNVELDIWNKIIDTVPELIGHHFNAAELGQSDQYDRALLAIGSGDFDFAEGILLPLTTPRVDANPSMLDLRYKATLHLAGIRRDRFQLTGPQGAIAMYREVWNFYCDIAARLRAQEAQFMLGVCNEMSDEPNKAAQIYEELKKSVERTDSAIAVRTSGRLGALMTKTGELEYAQVLLLNATSRSTALDDSTPYSFYHEKLAILHTRLKELDAAHKALRAARSEMKAPSKLRQIQSACVEAGIMKEADYPHAAAGLLKSALKKARDAGFAHQESHIRKMLTEIEDSG